MKETAKLRKLLAERRIKLDASEQDIGDAFDKVTVDGVDYYNFKKDVTHTDAFELAVKHGMRVLERWELCKLFDESEQARHALKGRRFWSASVYSGSRNVAWQFDGDYGSVNLSPRINTYGVVCIDFSISEGE